MPAMATTLTEFSTNGDSRTYTTSGHTASKPKLVIQKRRVPAGNQLMAETQVSIVHAAIGSDSEVLPAKVSHTVISRYPVNIKTGETTVADALAILKDVVASDEFAASVSSQNFVK